MNSRLLISISLTAIGTTFECTACSRQDAPQEHRPNIILFMVDDMGWQDTSLPFWSEATHYNRAFETPNMERLARQGMMFTQAYACSVSSPSRCSLMTGSNNARHRVTNWTLEKNKSTDIASKTLILPQWNYNGISQVEGIEHTYVGTSFVELLRRSGYHTIHCGKAHWGAIDCPAENPTHWGFEVNIAGHAAGGLATYLSERNYGHDSNGKPYSPMAIPGLEKYWGSGTFATEALTLETLKALDKAKRYNQPFYLYMSHYAVHIPIEKDMRFHPKYIEKGLSEKEAAYASLVEGMDKSLGDLMDWLERNDEADNTIIIFMSDNGGLASSPWARDGELHTQNYPLRSGKGSLHEGGIRIPMIACWPGVTKENSRCSDYMIIEDLYPTILEMAGVKEYDTPQPIDGISIVPLLKSEGNPSKGRALIWNFPNIWGNEGPGISLNCAIRQDEWKLIYYYESGKKELYNIHADIGEKHNLASSHPKIVKRLSAKLGRALRKMNARRPIIKSSNTPCPWPDEI